MENKNKYRGEETRGNGQKNQAGQGSRGMQENRGDQRSSSGEQVTTSGSSRGNVGRVQSPFALMGQLSQEMDRIFEDFWFEPFGRTPSRSTRRGSGNDLLGSVWAPAIEMHEHEGEWIVRADLPGMKKEEVQVELNDRALVIQGERRQGCQDTDQGWHHTECRYGSFFRSIPLPEGVDADEIRAEFDSGVLEIRMPAPQRKETKRNIEVHSREEQAESQR